MTRDEATRLVRDGGPIGGVYKSYDEALVDSLVALGILKLDEPKSAISKKIEKACSLSATKAADWQRLVRGLELAGLRIVEK